MAIVSTFPLLSRILRRRNARSCRDRTAAKFASKESREMDTGMVGQFLNQHIPHVIAIYQFGRPGQGRV